MPVTPAIAKTSTPDASSGNPIAVFTADAGAGSADSQAVVAVDPATGLPPAGGLPVAVQNFPASTATTVADGANVNQGANADAAVTGDTAGTLSAKLRGLSKMLADMWDSVNHRLNIFIQNATLAVTQSGNWVIAAGSAIIGSVKVTDGTNTATVKAPNVVPTASDSSLVVAISAATNGLPVTQAGPFVIATGANVMGSVKIVDSAAADQTSVKGTQTSRFLGTQDAKDAGRVSKVLSAFKFTPAVTEAMVTLTPVVNGGAGTTGTSFAVTAGKTWRLQSLTVVIEDSTTTAVGVAVYLRIGAAGAAIVTSPVIAAVAAALDGTQVARQATSNSVTFPDGIELSGAMQIGISQQGVATADATVVLVGYEY